LFAKGFDEIAHQEVFVAYPLAKVVMFAECGCFGEVGEVDLIELAFFDSNLKGVEEWDDWCCLQTPT